MLRLAIPNLSNVWQITLKDTSLISVTGLVEIMRQSHILQRDQHGSRYFYSLLQFFIFIVTFLSIEINQ